MYITDKKWYRHCFTIIEKVRPIARLAKCITAVWLAVIGGRGVSWLWRVAWEHTVVLPKIKKNWRQRNFKLPRTRCLTQRNEHTGQAMYLSMLISNKGNWLVYRSFPCSMYTKMSVMELLQAASKAITTLKWSDATMPIPNDGQLISLL